MEFLKNKWAYILLVTALILMVGASVYLYVMCRNREPYAGGMLVRLEQVLPAGMRTLAEGENRGEYADRVLEAADSIAADSAEEMIFL